MIKTRHKGSFLRQEYKEHFTGLFKTYNEFVKTMSSDAGICESCGFYFWTDCKCKCKTKK